MAPCCPAQQYINPAQQYINECVRYNTLSPTWNETILVTVTADDMLHPNHVVRFSVYDQDISSKNDHIGRADLLLSQLVAEGREVEIELKLIPSAKKGETPGEGCAGFLKIKFDCSAIENVRSRAVRDLFGRFDRDGNGQLDATEFQQLQSCLSADGQRSSVFGRADENKDGFVDMNELFKCVEDLIPDDVVADYFVKTASSALRLHEPGQKGAALTEEQAGRGWLVSVTEWVSRDKCVRGNFFQLFNFCGCWHERFSAWHGHAFSFSLCTLLQIRRRSARWAQSRPHCGLQPRYWSPRGGNHRPCSGFFDEGSLSNVCCVTCDV